MASLVTEMSPTVSARIAVTTRPATGAPVPSDQNSTIRRRTPRPRTCNRSSPESARAATGRSANSVNRNAMPADHQGGDADRECRGHRALGLEQERSAG